MASPIAVVIAGPNGAGKTTAARRLLRDDLAVERFVNADAIAARMRRCAYAAADLAAGKVMLARLRRLAAQRRRFAFETTLASRTFAPWLAQLAVRGYRTHLIYLAVESPYMAVARVAARRMPACSTGSCAPSRRRGATSMKRIGEQDYRSWSGATVASRRFPRTRSRA